MTKNQPTMPTIKRDELYAALYTDLSGYDESEQNTIRENTLKTVLGVKNIESLKKKLEDYNEVQMALKSLKKVDAEKTSITKLQNIQGYWNAIKLYWDAIHDLYVCYLEALRKKQVRTRIPINKILIYEAPRPPKGKKINYILAESCELCVKSNNCNDNFQIHPSGPYVDTIKGLVEGPTTKTIQDILVEKGILFIDLCPLPLPMITDIRRDVWGKPLEENDDKPLSVVLLELALEFVSNYDIEISHKPIIAMGTPTATSQSIYYYFEKKEANLSIKKNGCDTEAVDFSKLLNINKKYETLEQILPLYASNIISGSNTPNAELLKRIF